MYYYPEKSAHVKHDLNFLLSRFIFSFSIFVPGDMGVHKLPTERLFSENPAILSGVFGDDICSDQSIWSSWQPVSRACPPSLFLCPSLSSRIVWERASQVSLWLKTDANMPRKRGAFDDPMSGPSFRGCALSLSLSLCYAPDV